MKDANLHLFCKSISASNEFFFKSGSFTNLLFSIDIPALILAHTYK